MERTPTDILQNQYPWWRDPGVQKAPAVLLLTVVLGLLCGVAQLMALAVAPALLPAGILLAAGYLLLVLSRKLAALVIFVLAFVEFCGLVPDVTEVRGIKLIDIVTALA